MWDTTARANTDLTFISMILEDTSISPEDRLTIVSLRGAHWLENLESTGLKARFVWNAAQAHDRWSRRYRDVPSSQDMIHTED